MSAHSKWSASSSSRNLACPGNIALQEGLPKSASGYAAMWGTACHQLCEWSLTRGVTADSFLGEYITTEVSQGVTEQYEVDSDMIECANVYLDYVALRRSQGFDLVGVEIKFDLATLGAAMQAGGTADCVLYHPELKELEVIDLKTGKGVLVEVEGNAQARFYAVGTATALPKLPIVTFRSTIVQPRIAHRDGRIRSEQMNALHMFEWAVELVGAIDTAQKALDGFHAAAGRSDLIDRWTDRYLVAGGWCQYCPAAGGCPKLRKLALETAGTDTSRGTPVFLSENAPAVVERDMDLIPLLEEWIAARRALAHQLALDGHVFDHHMLVEKIGHRKFMVNGSTEPRAVVNAILSRINLSNEQLYEEPKLRSPASLEKAIGKKTVADRLGDLIVKPVTGTDLVSTQGTVNTRRTPVKGTSERFFVNKEQ